MRATKNATDGKDRTFAIVDYSGGIAGPLTAVAGMYDSSAPGLAEAGLVRKGPRFIPDRDQA